MHAAIWGLTTRWSAKSSSSSSSSDEACGVITELISRGARVDIPDGDGCRLKPLITSHIFPFDVNFICRQRRGAS
jgi:hypothetical protein